MSLGDALALSVAMLVLAAMPSVSVLAVVSRSVALDVRHGIATALGIVAGDVVFIAMAIVGMTVLAAWAESLFAAIQLLGGVYLIWLGLTLWRGRPASAEAPEMAEGNSLGASFMVGLLITLADQKAVLFYLGFFPAFVDLATISVPEALLVGEGD